MPFYPVGCQVTGIDLSSAMLARASKRRSKLGKDVELLEMDLASPSWPVNIWLTAMLRLFQPQIMELVRERDATVANWQKEHSDVDPFEDRGCDITSVRKVSVAAQIQRVNEALMAVAA